ncbi:MAG: SusC/RagA family TonB-linked outer membrane protein [Gemmatimonadaceae bacterium]|nr:SusC/RagA family TonB-linked outer membrane protein [Gemmatimonadaceae bacterium]
MPTIVRRILAVILVLAAAGPKLQAQAGSGTRIIGRVTDGAGGAPLEGAQVRVDGTNIGTITGDDGRYVISRIQPGQFQLRVIRIGYLAALKPATVRANESATVDFALTRAPYQLEGVVTTATGQTLTRELGNSIAKIDAAKLVEEQPITSMQDVLNGRTAGVSMLASSGTVGGGARIRIRGLSSASLSNDPLILVDGVRVEQASPALAGTLYVGGGRPSFLNNLNPDEIESLEIVKGPSAATLYGTQAANGVIVITTKRGKAGPPKWTLYGEGGTSYDPAEYPGIYYTEGRSPSGATRGCLQWQQAVGDCTITQAYSRNLLEDAATTPIDRGQRQQYGAQVSGGTEAARYFISADWENELGLLRMPAAELDSLFKERGVTNIPRDQRIPNQLTKSSLRANLGVQLSPQADLSVSSGYVNSYNLLPQTGDNLQGVIGSGLFGNPNPALANQWGFAPPSQGFAKSVSRYTNQFLNSATAVWRPTSFLSSRATLGMDWMAYNNEARVANGQGCLSCGIERQGVRTIDRWSNNRWTLDLNTAASFNLRSDLTSKTAVGAQWNRDRLTGSLNTANILPPGGTTIDAGSQRVSGEQTIETVSYGLYVEQTLGWRDKLFLTGAVRRDQNSAFGGDFGSIVYPKATLSWVALENSDARWINQFRPRFAFGESGQQPTATAAITFLTPTTTTIFGQGDVPAVTFGALGNTTIKPERSREIETGFDFTTLHNRVSLQVTYYDKKTTDALVNRPLPGSLGAGASRIENVGTVTNKGIEVSLNARVVDRDDVRWDVGVEASGNKNRLESLAEGIPPLTGFGFQNRPGYPLFGLWWPRLTSFADANGNNIIEPSEVTVTDTAAFNGSTVPVRTISVNSSIGLFKDRLRMSGLLDYRGGFVSHNVNGMFQCAFRQNCAALHVAGYDLEEQAKAVAGPRAFGAYGEKADFVRLREISVLYALTPNLASMVKASGVSIVLTGRNLALWTDFTSWDPENNTSGTDGPNYNFVQQAQPRVFLLRINLTY